MHKVLREAARELLIDGAGVAMVAAALMLRDAGHAVLPVLVGTAGVVVIVLGLFVFRRV